MRGTHYLVPLLGLAPVACDASPTHRGSSPVAVRASAQAAAVELVAADGVRVHGTFYPAANPKALILLFHQAGSNKGEYATIAPRLVAAGYSALAIDQRSGGTMFGDINQTAAGLKKEASFADAAKDLRAALAWAADKKLPVILWGSSYSSSLVLQLAAEQPDKVAAVLAFSPGEYFGDGQPVRGWASRVTAPLFVTSAKDDDEIAAAKALLAASPSANKRQYVPASGGVHGSATLITARNRAGADDNMRAVLTFLGDVTR